MKVDHKRNADVRRKAERPTLEEKVDALIAGGQKLADLKQRLAELNVKYPEVRP